MRRSHADLVITAALALAALLVNVIGTTSADIAESPLRIVFGLLLALVLPGYALAQAMFPSRILSLSEQLMLGVGLSLGSSVLGGLVLNLTPLGMNTSSWAVLLGGITLVACLAASYARVQLNGDPEGFGRPSSTLALLRQWPVLLSAIALVVAAVVFARNEANNDPVPIVQLWMLRDEKAASPTVRIGINNVNSKATQYRLRLQLHSGRVLQDWPTITVPPATGWETHLDLGAQAPKGEPLEAILYRADVPNDEFRHATVWLK